MSNCTERRCGFERDGGLLKARRIVELYSADKCCSCCCTIPRPGIVNNRPVTVALDLRELPQGQLQAGTNCWTRSFLRSLPDLPDGLRVSVDNGVRCPCPKALKVSEYEKRLAYCTTKTESWLSSLVHPDQGLPVVLLCDRDMTYGLASSKKLVLPNGDAWSPPSVFIDAIGTELRFGALTALVAAHPSVVSRYKSYRDKFNHLQIAKRTLELARLS